MLQISPSHAVENYLRIIHDLTAHYGIATTSQIAERLEITPASVTGMIKKLAAAEVPLVVYHKHRGVTLTPEGEKIALEVIRHHRLIELYLHENLGYSWDEVDAEADLLEHVISETFEERIAQALGDPLHDPHGDPIPTRDLYLPPPSSVPLVDLRSGQRASVQRVQDNDPELLRHLSSIGLIPQARLSVVDFSPFDGNLHIQIEGADRILVLGPLVTRQVFVKVL